jgi:hypothetical protein
MTAANADAFLGDADAFLGDADAFLGDADAADAISFIIFLIFK